MNLRAPVVLSLLASAFGASTPTARPALAGEPQVLVYGFLFEQRCGSKYAYRSFQSQLVGASAAPAARKRMEDQLKAKYPGSNVRAGTSSFDYGKDAHAMTAIAWTAKSGSCSYEVGAVAFGKTVEEARKRATSAKNSEAGPAAPSRQIAQEYW